MRDKILQEVPTSKADVGHTFFAIFSPFVSAIRKTVEKLKKLPPLRVPTRYHFIEKKPSMIGAILWLKSCTPTQGQGLKNTHAHITIKPMHSSLLEAKNSWCSEIHFNNGAYLCFVLTRD